MVQPFWNFWCELWSACSKELYTSRGVFWGRSKHLVLGSQCLQSHLQVCVRWKASDKNKDQDEEREGAKFLIIASCGAGVDVVWESEPQLVGLWNTWPDQISFRISIFHQRQMWIWTQIKVPQPMMYLFRWSYTTANLNICRWKQLWDLCSSHCC